MEVTRKTIYELTAERKCGCKAVGRYSDAAYKEVETEPVFKPCDKHAEAPLFDMMSMILIEDVEKEAKDTKVALVPQNVPQLTVVSAAAPGDNPFPAAEASPAPEGGVVVPIPPTNRPIRPNRPAGSHRPAGTGGGPMIKTITRVRPVGDPGAGLSAQAQAALAHSKTAGIVNEPGEAPDPRVQSLIEATLFANDPLGEEGLDGDDNDGV